MERTAEALAEKYPYLKVYERPSNYIGATYEGCFIVTGTHRDADSIQRSNWRRILEDFGELDGVFTASANHWAVGWVELLYVDPREASDETLEALNKVNYEEAMKYWDSESLAYRVSLCQEAGVSIFGARPGRFPEDSDGRLYELLRD